jgi:hypothetical protein
MVLGMTVTAIVLMDGKWEQVILHNVTEVHYGYSLLKVAFESDIHGTGTTYHLDERWPMYLKEFQAKPATELAEEFYESKRRV